MTANEFESTQLTDFNIDGHIVLSQKFGLLKMMRSDDGALVLVEYAEYGRIDQEKPTPSTCLSRDSVLGFVMDIGIRREKNLTHAGGFYFGTKLLEAQSTRKVSQTDFDQPLFEDIGTLIETYYQSGDLAKEQIALKIQLLMNEYNNARLLFPNFYADSYLNMMRIIDALCGGRSAFDFATFVAMISSKTNQEIYTKLQAVGSYADRIQTALNLFNNECVPKATKEKLSCLADMTALDDAGKLVFACFYSAYQYRNKFVHQGFPFPDTVKDAHGIDVDSGTAYLSPALGISWSRFHRPEGLQTGDLFDVHEIVGAEATNFKEKYFLLLPTWYFLKRLTRQALLNKIKSLPI